MKRKNSSRRSEVIVPKKENEGTTWQKEREARAIIKSLSEKASVGDADAVNCLKWVAIEAAEKVMNCAATNREDAAQAAFEVASSIVDGLEKLHDKGTSDVLKKIARKNTRWPGFSYCHPEEKEKAEKRIHSIELGRGTGLNFEGKFFYLSAESTNIALRLKEQLDALRLPPNRLSPSRRRRASLSTQQLAEAEKEAEKICADAAALPPLNRETYSAWWRVAWRLMVFSTGENFEDHEYFINYRKNAAITTTGGLALNRARLRSRIKRMIQQSFHSIAAKVR